MQDAKRRNAQSHAGNRAGIWLALSVALGLHLALLLVPLASQKQPVRETGQTKLELQLTASRPRNLSPPAPLPGPDEPLPEPSRFETEQAGLAHEEQTGPLPSMTESPADTIEKNQPPELDDLNELEKSRLTSTILARQFFTQESAADQLFGKQVMRDGSELQEGFRYPDRQDMLTMLDQPLPDVPFAYTPGLVNFAYEPGVKGDIQRFWDFITPEFGWRTRYGTEVRCKLILVIAGCAWK